MWEMLKNQMLASLATLNQCVKNCPDAEWNESHRDAPFSQVLFHTLFYLDYYLSRDVEEFKAQKFHCGHKELFRDYEELEYREAQEIYSRDEIETYIDFCRKKIEGFFGEANERDPLEKTGFRNRTVLEVVIDNTRHVQHHAAQLGLRVQQITGKCLQWVAWGWEQNH